MIESVSIPEGPSLDDYAASAHLAAAVSDLRETAERVVPKLAGRTVWQVNSTARGGGVAEMLPRQVGLLTELGLDTRWVTIGTERTAFFELTKRLHNLLHGVGAPTVSTSDHDLYSLVSHELADEFGPWLGGDDVLFIHDPQPAGMGSLLAESRGLDSVWRCHIGLDERLPAVDAGWSLLEPYLSGYDRAVFTAHEYVPEFLAERSHIIRPALDPYGAKNRTLRPAELVEVLVRSGLHRPPRPSTHTPYSRPVERLQDDGTFAPATEPADLSLLYRPVVLEVSRWDRLKGWVPLVEAFAELKRRAIDESDPVRRAVLSESVLLLAGPEPAAVRDDPEAVDVLAELTELYRGLPAALRADVALLSLPMGDATENALIVNALQSLATVVVQNSVREGFGLTATEPQWKGTPVLVSSACGLRQQVTAGVEGDMVRDAEDSQEIAVALTRLLTDPARRQRLARNAQRRVSEEFLVFHQIRHELLVLEHLIS